MNPFNNHIIPLHSKGFIHKHRIKQVLIEYGVDLNICTLQLIISLGYAKGEVDARKKITIKAYDNAECSSKGCVTLPIRVGPVVKNVICQVLDLSHPYNLLLDRPWIHAMEAVPSTYHQCIKFPHSRVEITILGDSNPFAFCNNISHHLDIMVPSNKEATVSSSYVHPNSLTSTPIPTPK